jgi:hypothetical protein
MSDLSPDAKDLWTRAKAGFDPTDAQIDRVRGAVLQKIAAGPGSPFARGSLLKWAKIASALVVAGGLVTTGVKLASRRAPAPEETPPVAVPTPEAPAPVAPAPNVEPQPAAPALAPADAPRARAKSESGRASSSSASGQQASDTLPEEVRIISEAKLALRRNAYADALSKINEYTARYPKGVFAEEELALRVVALCGLGRQKEATRALSTLERNFPGSRHLDRVRSSCAGPQMPAP